MIHLLVHNINTICSCSAKFDPITQNLPWLGKGIHRSQEITVFVLALKTKEPSHLEQSIEPFRDTVFIIVKWRSLTGWSLTLLPYLSFYRILRKLWLAGWFSPWWICFFSWIKFSLNSVNPELVCWASDLYNQGPGCHTYQLRNSECKGKEKQNLLTQEKKKERRKRKIELICSLNWKVYE